MIIGGSEKRLIPVQRDCDALLVPTGTPIKLQKDTFVTLTQSQGGSYTVVVNGNMARVDSIDADALGFDPLVLEFEQPADGRVDPEQVQSALETIFESRDTRKHIGIRIGLWYGN